MNNWLKTILEHEESKDIRDHIDIEDLARFAEGKTEPDEREVIINHIDQCSDCYEIVRSTRSALSLDEQKEAATHRKKRRQFFAIAASIILFVFMGSWMTYTTLFKTPLTAEIEIDKEIRDMLALAHTLQWSGERVVKMAELLREKGVKIKSFSKIKLNAKYSPTRVFPPPKEILKIEVIDNVAHIKVVLEKNKE